MWLIYVSRLMSKIQNSNSTPNDADILPQKIIPTNQHESFQPCLSLLTCIL